MANGAKDKQDDNDKEEEVVKGWKTRSRGGGYGEIFSISKTSNFQNTRNLKSDQFFCFMQMCLILRQKSMYALLRLKLSLVT